MREWNLKLVRTKWAIAVKIEWMERKNRFKESHAEKKEKGWRGIVHTEKQFINVVRWPNWRDSSSRSEKDEED